VGSNFSILQHLLLRTDRRRFVSNLTTVRLRALFPLARIVSQSLRRRFCNTFSFCVHPQTVWLHCPSD